MAKLIRNANGELETFGEAGGEPATTTTAGSMSAEDKVKLDALEVGGEEEGGVLISFDLYKAVLAPPFVRDQESSYTLDLGLFDFSLMTSNPLWSDDVCFALVMRTLGTVGVAKIRVIWPEIGTFDLVFAEDGLGSSPSMTVVRQMSTEISVNFRKLAPVQLVVTFDGPGPREIDFVQVFATRTNARSAMGWGDFTPGV